MTTYECELFGLINIVMNKKYFLYYLYDLHDNVKYVGVTINPQKRAINHKLSKPPHKFIMVESFDSPIEATLQEIKHIETHKTTLNGWNKSPGGEYEKSSGYHRKGIGGVPKGSKPWNYKKKNCFSEETKQKFRNKRKGICYSPRKISKEQIDEIKKIYDIKESLPDVGKIMKNGVSMSYDRAFARKYAPVYGVTENNICRIIKKSWLKSTKDFK